MAELAEKWEKELDSFPRRIWFDGLRVFSAMSTQARLDAYLRRGAVRGTRTGTESDGQRLDECCLRARQGGGIRKSSTGTLGAMQASTVLNRRALWLSRAGFTEEVRLWTTGETSGLFGILRKR